MPATTVALDPALPFTRAQALSAGLPRRALTSGRFRRIVWGVYLDATVTLTPLLEARAALLVSPDGSHASHHTAARIWGGVVPDQPLIHVCSAPGSTRCQRQGIRAHECADLHGPVPAPGPSGTAALEGGVRTSAPVRSFLELASLLGLVDLVVLGDSLVKARGVAPTEFVAAADEWHGPGAVLARRAARYVRAGVDSPMETRLRMLMVLAGLPEPTVNHVILWPDGSWRWRFDLAYPEHRLAIEYDGRHHVEDDGTWEADIHRREDLERWRWRRLTVISPGIFKHPDQTLGRIVRVMREVGVPGTPRHLSDEWRKHFPVRPKSYLSSRH